MTLLSKRLGAGEMIVMSVVHLTRLSVAKIYVYELQEPLLNVNVNRFLRLHQPPQCKCT